MSVKKNSEKRLREHARRARMRGVLHALATSDWMEMAEELSLLTNEEFKQVIGAINTFRRADRRALESSGPMIATRLPRSRMRIRRAG